MLDVLLLASVATTRWHGKKIKKKKIRWTSRNNDCKGGKKRFY